jgi:hypothetical protein
MENDKDIATWQDPIEKSAPYHLPDPEFDYSILSLLGRDSIAEADGTESSRESLTLSSPICGSECGSIQDVDETNLLNVLAEADTDIFEDSENGFTYEDSTHNLSHGYESDDNSLEGEGAAADEDDSLGSELGVPALILLQRKRFLTLEVQDNVHYLNSTRVTSIVLNSFLGDADTRSEATRSSHISSGGAEVRRSYSLFMCSSHIKAIIPMVNDPEYFKDCQLHQD